MPAPLQRVPLFLTHHAPVGAFASLVFGIPGRGASIRDGSAATCLDADLLIALERRGQTHAFPFLRNPADYPAWQPLPADQITRGISPCIDEYAAPTLGATLRLFAPHPALPNPKRAGNLQFATAPGILLELQIDNSASDDPATAFLGLGFPETHEPAAPPCPAALLRPLDWSSKTLCGIAHAGQWLLASPAIKNETFTLLSNDIPAALAASESAIDPLAHSGGITIKIPPRTSRTFPIVFAWYVHGPVTQGGGIDGRCIYTNYFPGAQAVANFLLHNAARLRESCESFDTRIASATSDPAKTAILSQALRAYDAATQVIEAPAPAALAGHHNPAPQGPTVFFATIDPENLRRNPLDSIADRLPWDLFRNPWVIRNLFDLATAQYAYHDRLHIPGTSAGGELIPMSVTFARDFGIAGSYAPASAPVSSADPEARSAFDAAGGAPGWSGGKFATEVLLNSIYMLTGYALLAQDTPWAKTRLPFARELLTGLENRDHPDPAQRTGILKADSASANGPEQTALAGDSRALAPARGSLYIAIKTFCANLLLTTYFQNNNDLHSADYSYAFARKTAAAIAAAFNPQTQSLPANLLSPAPPPPAPLALAALQPLALPTWLGLTSTLQEYFPELFAALSAHVQSCIKPAPQGCFDPAGPTLRLVSTEPPPRPARIIPILFVLERLFQIDPDTQFPNLWKSLADSLQQNASRQPINLQPLSAALFLKPAV